MVPGIQQRHRVTRDGTRIGYQVRGDGPCIVFANGLGGTYITFRYLYDAIDTGYKAICWDYRGLYSSGVSADPLANTKVQFLAHDGGFRRFSVLFALWNIVHGQELLELVETVLIFEQRDVETT